MNADPPPPPPPPWVWMVPGSAGLLRLGAGVAPPPVLLASAQPPAAPLLPGLPGWQAPGEPFLPLLPLPSAPDHAAAAAVHHYPLLNGQVTCPPSPGPGLRVAGYTLCPPARPSPRSGGSGPVARSCLPRRSSAPQTVRAQPGSHAQATKFMLRRPVLPPGSFCGVSLGLSAEQFGDPHPKAGVGTALAITFARAEVAVQRAVLK